MAEYGEDKLRVSLFFIIIIFFIFFYHQFCYKNSSSIGVEQFFHWRII